MTWETAIGSHAGRIRIEGSLPSLPLRVQNHDRQGVERVRFRYQREDGTVLEGDFSIQPMEPGCFSVLIGGRSYRIEPGAPGELLVNGAPLAAGAFDPRSLRGRKSSAAGHGRQNVSAPMPGKVVRVLVSAGDDVEAGQGLVVVEAM